MQLPVLRVGSVELYADVQPRAQDAVASHSAVAMPRQVGKTGYGIGNLHDDAHPVEPVGAGQHAGVGDRGQPAQPRILSKLGQPG